MSLPSLWLHSSPIALQDSSTQADCLTGCWFFLCNPVDHYLDHFAQPDLNSWSQAYWQWISTVVDHRLPFLSFTLPFESGGSWILGQVVSLAPVFESFDEACFAQARLGTVVRSTCTLRPECFYAWDPSWRIDLKWGSCYRLLLDLRQRRSQLAFQVCGVGILHQ